METTERNGIYQDDIRIIRHPVPGEHHKVVAMSDRGREFLLEDGHAFPGCEFFGVRGDNLRVPTGLVANFVAIATKYGVCVGVAR